MRRAAAVCTISVALTLVSAGLAVAAASVHARFDLGSLQGSPFPANTFTVADSTQNTGLRVNLPKPDCAARPVPSDCSDIDVLNELDGFNLEPRLSIPFDGPIDVGSVTSHDVFVVSLGSTLPDGDGGGEVVGIDQVVRDTFTNTLYVESDEPLDQHTRYVLVVTQSVLDANGKHVKAAKEFLDLVNNVDGASTDDPALEAYRTSLRDALLQIDKAGIVPVDQVVAASLFTTLSATAVMEKIRDQIKLATPAPADFLLGPDESRTVFDRSTVTDIRWSRQQMVDPAAFSEISLSISKALDVVPGAVGTIAFGRYSAPDYRVHPVHSGETGEYIPAVGTRSGTPLVHGMNEITFVLYLPSSPEPAGGYPVAISGHGGSENKTASQLVAANLAAKGIATIAIDGPGYGFGPLSTYSILFTDSSSMTFFSGGRGIDQNGDHRIVAGEGFYAASPRSNLDVSGRDGHRQWAAEHMQLVREIEVGMDVDGDDTPDLDPSRIYYLGHSGGGRQGAIFLAVEPSVRAGVLSAPNGSIEERLSAARGGFPPVLQPRLPSVINSSGITSVNGISVPTPYFNENLPLRNGASFTVTLQNNGSQTVRSPVKNTVPGATQIQQVLENIEWASQSASSIAYAPHLRGYPLSGVPAKSVIIQFAYGDRLVPNPSTTALLRAGDLVDRATFFRTDVAFPVAPFPSSALYPHTFMDAAITNDNSDVKEIAMDAQEQIASFFALDGDDHVLDPFDGTQVSNPDPRFFEVPIVPPLPEALNYYTSVTP
jgi:Bacterial virulence factor lipase N-terminal